MPTKPYGMICPITQACNILEPRWTIPILVALWAGCTKFNDIRREIGTISPGLLSKRLRDLEAYGLVRRIDDRATGTVSYVRTDMAIALEPALDGLAHWAQRHIEAEFALSTVDATTLMWKLRTKFVHDHLPERRVVMRFRFSDEGLDYDTYYAIICRSGEVEICTSEIRYEIDLFVETNVPSLAGIMLGRTSVAREIEEGGLFLSGDPVLARTMDRWLDIHGAYSTIDGIAQMPERLCRAPARRVAV